MVPSTATSQAGVSRAVASWGFGSGCVIAMDNPGISPSTGSSYGCRARALRGVFRTQAAQGCDSGYLAGCWLGIAEGRSGRPGRPC